MVQKVRLGRSDLVVTPIGLGTNAVGGHNLYPNLDEQVGKELVRAALRHDVDFLDTAFIYGPKRSEELVGEVVKESGMRQKIVLATKAAHRFIGNDAVMDNSPAFLKQSVEEAMRRLQTDYIDLFYIHFPDDKTPKYEAVGTLKELKDQGKIRAIGVSNFTLDQLKEANQDGYVDVFQGGYNLLDRGAEKDFLPYTAENQISFVPFFPLASGLLAGKYTKDTKFGPKDLRSDMPHFQGEAFKKNLEKVEQLRKMAEAKGAEVAHIVLAWYLTRSSIDVVIPGAKNPEQVLNNLNTLNVELSVNEIEEIDRIFK